MRKGAKVAHVDTMEKALHALRSGQGYMVMMDVMLPIGSLIEQIQAERIFVPVVACGIGNDTQAAVRAIKDGAKEYIPLPPDVDLIAAVLEAVSQDNHKVIYRDPAMGRIVKLAEQIAPSQASVLITGESGTGKEVIAQFIHSKSKRADHNFISVNCAAIPENLLESELFGHEKGAFTGAVARRVGKFEEANGGTLLLDEVTEMDPRLQAKLLRAIQEREIDRLGGSQPVKIDIRLIATSNRDMMEAVKDGTFREDLYFRLNVFNLQIPPLRKRPQDIAVLADYFIKKYAAANGVLPLPLSDKALAKLELYSWRGNVRELENTMHRAVLLAEGTRIEDNAIMMTSDLLKLAEESDDDLEAMVTSLDAVAGSDHPLIGRTVADVERDLILNTLDHCLGNRTHAANILGISIRTLRNKLKQYEDEGMKVARG
ncbi:MAG: sigma-54-dependent transcriptional regulator [Alphaproteobacteria bacterium]